MRQEVRDRTLTVLLFTNGVVMKKYAAEFVGTFWLVLGGAAAVLAATFPTSNRLRRLARVVLTVLTMAFAIGHISGRHLNPANFGRPPDRRPLSARDLLYVVSQVLGGCRRRHPLFDRQRKAGSSMPASPRTATASNSSAVSPMAALVCEVAMTAMFLFVMGRPSARRPGWRRSRSALPPRSSTWSRSR